MTKNEIVSLLESRGIRVLLMRMEDGVPKATIPWQDYPRLIGPFGCSALTRGEFRIALR